MRMSIPVLFIVSIIVNIGMWLERFMIVVVSLHRDYMPSRPAGMYYPTFWDLATFFGSVGMFLALMFLFIRVLPMISIFEMHASWWENGNEAETQTAAVRCRRGV